MAASLFVCAAQSVTVTVTNYVTVTVTNVITITNTVTRLSVSPTNTALLATVSATNVAPLALESSTNNAPLAHVSPAVAAIAAGVPAAPAIKPKYAWQSAVSLGLTMTRGNSDSTLFVADFTTQRKTPFDEYKIELKGAYGNQDGVQTANNYQGSVQWNHLFTERFYGYTRAEGERDIISAVNYRVTVGPGLGYYFLKSTNTTFATEAGGAFQAQQLNDSSNTSTNPADDLGSNQTFATLRFAERFEHKINNHARIWENAEIRPQVNDFNNYIVSAEIGVETTLSKSFSLKTFLDNDYNNVPAPGKLKNDAKIVAALGYKF